LNGGFILRERYFFGILLILLGLGFLADQLGYFQMGEIISTYWPLVLIIAGITGLFDRKSSKMGNLIVLALGILFQLNRLDYLEVEVFRLFWPIVLIIVGLNILFTKGISNHNVKVDPDKWSTNVIEDATVDSFVIFSGLETNNQSQEFKGGKLTAVFGGIDLRLTEANLYNNEAFIDATTLFGGIDIIVPNNWRVEMTGTPIFGSWSNNARSNPDPDAPVLKIRCMPIFGGIDVK
jgi:predicted membrane protein